MDVDGVAAVVTGGVSGLGRATVELLAAKGAKVAILDLDADAGRELATRIGGSFEQVDVSNEAAVASALAGAADAHGVARLLVNCAGYMPIGSVVGADGTAHAAGVYRRSLEVNLLGTLLIVAQFAALLAKADPIGEERGVIVNTASIAAYGGQTAQTAYATAKAGIVGFTLPAARDLARHAIRVVTIAPGMFRTPMLAQVPDEVQRQLGARVPFPNRLGQPEEFARMVLSIVGNPMLNGEVIRLDGAYRLQA